MKNFADIHNALISNGFPECSDGEWLIKLEDYSQQPLIVPHWYDAHTKAQTKELVKTLLNMTDNYDVTVYHGKQRISFHGSFNELSEHEWNYYFGR
jgi:hypothetical protein